MTEDKREIGERIATIEGEIRHLATEAFVRKVVQDQTAKLNKKFDRIDEKFDTLDGLLRDLIGRQQRFKGIGQALTFGIPFLISVKEE